MKKLILCFSVLAFAVACTNNASKENSAADSSSNIVLPKDRSSDSLAIPPAATDSMGMKKDSSK